MTLCLDKGLSGLPEAGSERFAKVRSEPKMRTSLRARASELTLATMAAASGSGASAFEGTVSKPWTLKEWTELQGHAAEIEPLHLRDLVRVRLLRTFGFTICGTRIPISIHHKIYDLCQYALISLRRTKSGAPRSVQKHPASLSTTLASE